jgi:hypothetical protein
MGNENETKKKSSRFKKFVVIPIIGLMLICACIAILVIALPESETSTVSEPPAQMEQAQSEISDERTEPEATALPTETPSADGSSPDLAIPFGEEANIRHYSLLITDVERPADETLANANMFNPQGDVGNEMLLLQLTITCTRDTSETCSVSPYLEFELFGSRGVIYEPKVIVGLSGTMDRTEFFGGRSITGWVAFEVGEDETDLIFKFEPFLSLTRPVYMKLPEKE